MTTGDADARRNAVSAPGTTPILRSVEPARWKGPSIALWTRSGSNAQIFVCGYFTEWLRWEGRYTSTSPLLASIGEQTEADLSSQARHALGKCDEISIEVDLDDGLADTETYRRAQAVLASIAAVGPGGDLASISLPDDLPAYASVTSTANKLPDLPERLSRGELLDLASAALPNRHGSTEWPLSFCKRRCRLLVGDRASIILWLAPEPQDALNWIHEEPKAQRWPHHGIPGFSVSDAKPPMVSTGAGDRALVFRLFERIIESEIYYLGHLRTEIELVEGRFYQHLRSDTVPVTRAVAEGRAIDAHLDTVAHIDRYLTQVREISTRLRRRIEVGKLASLLEVECTLLHGSLSNALNVLEGALQSRRLELRSSLQTVSTSTEVTALREHIREQARTERFRAFASALALAFSIASLSVAVYGSNIRDLTPVQGRSVLMLVAGSTGVIALVYLISRGRLAWRRRRRRSNPPDVRSLAWPP